jgi:hypothetical protein
MYIVIDVDDSLTDAMVRRQLADVQKLLGDEDYADGWAGLETAFKWFKVSRIVGVILTGPSPQCSVPAFVTPLEGSKAVEL